MDKNRFFVNTDFDVDVLRNVLRKNAIYAFLILGCIGVIGFLYLRYTKPIFQSQMSIQIDNEDQGANILDLKNVNNDGANLSKEIELLRSQFLFEEALKKLNLSVSHYAKGEFLTEERYLQSSFIVKTINLFDSTIINTPIYISNIGEKYFLEYNFHGEQKKEEITLNQPYKNIYFHIIISVENLNSLNNDLDQNELYFVFNNQLNLLGKLHSNLKIEPLDIKAKSILISYRSNNAHLSRDICNAVGESFFEYDDYLQQESSEKILRFINQQLDSLNKELIKSRDALTTFQREQNLSDIENIEKSSAARINQLENQLNQLLLEQNDLMRIEQEINAAPKSTEVYKLLPVLIEKGFENSLKSQLENLYEKLERKENLLYAITPESNTIKRLNEKINTDIEILNKIIAALKRKTEERVTFLRKEIALEEENFYTLPDKKMELNRLINIQELNEKYYTSLNEKKVAYAISNAGFTSNNKVLSKAQLNNVPIEPNRFKTYYTYFVLGLLLAIIFLFVKYVGYDELSTINDLEKLTDNKLSILGAIPLKETNHKHSQLMVYKDPKSNLAESFRGVRSNLKFINPGAQTIAISSSISGEGKTFIALNLSAILAMSGKSVIMLDLDLRKPKVHLGLGIENNKGISNYLSSNSKLEECIVSEIIPNVDVITAGSIPPNPSELILSKHLNELISELKKRYDYVIIDNPPVGIVSDGVQVLHDADIPIYVFKANYSKRHFLKRVIELKELQKINSINLILNGVQQRGNKYGYGYGYGYGYDYTDENQNKRKSIFKK